MCRMRFGPGWLEMAARSGPSPQADPGIQPTREESRRPSSTLHVPELHKTAVPYTFMYQNYT